MDDDISYRRDVSLTEFNLGLPRNAQAWKSCYKTAGTLIVLKKSLNMPA